jgi:hypothetical protein
VTIRHSHHPARRDRPPSMAGPPAYRPTGARGTGHFDGGDPDRGRATVAWSPGRSYDRRSPRSAGRPAFRAIFVPPSAGSMVYHVAQRRSHASTCRNWPELKPDGPCASPDLDPGYGCPGGVHPRARGRSAPTGRADGGCRVGRVVTTRILRTRPASQSRCQARSQQRQARRPSGRQPLKYERTRSEGLPLRAAGSHPVQEPGDIEVAGGQEGSDPDASAQHAA